MSIMIIIFDCWDCWTYLMPFMLMCIILYENVSNLLHLSIYLPHSYQFRFPQGTCSFLVALTLKST